MASRELTCEMHKCEENNTDIKNKNKRRQQIYFKLIIRQIKRILSKFNSILYKNMHPSLKSVYLTKKNQYNIGRFAFSRD